MAILNNKMQLLAALVLLLGIAQVHGMAYHCRAINVCDDAVDAKWTERAVDNAFSKYSLKVAYNWEPATTPGCLAKKCNTPVTVAFKTPASADVTLLDETIAQTIANPALLSKTAVCVQDTTATMLAADKTCAPVKPVGLKGSVLCRSTQVCSDLEDFAWVEVTADKAVAAFLKKNGLAADGISVDKAAAVKGCTCKNPTTITVTAKVPTAKNFAAMDAGLAATLAALATSLTAACTADATPTYLAAHPLCKKPTAAPVKKVTSTVCRDVDLCDNAVDFAWTRIASEDAFEPLFKALKVPQDEAHFSVTKLDGAALKAGSVSCTCKTRAVVKITVPAGAGVAEKVDAFIAKAKASLSTVQCLASSASASCKQPGGTSGVVGCRTWTLADDNADWAWTVNSVKKALAPCFAVTKTPTSGLSIARSAGTCAKIGGKQCCAANIATVKVSSVPKGQDGAFAICARSALSVASLGKPFTCAGAARC